MKGKRREKEEEDEREEADNKEQEGEEINNPIEKLQDFGINAGDIKKLQDAGFATVESVTMCIKKSLVNIKGLSEAKVDKIIEAASKICDLGFKKSSKFLEKRMNLVKITTGSQELDNLLQGGIESGSLTEIFG